MLDGYSTIDLYAIGTGVKQNRTAAIIGGVAAAVGVILILSLVIVVVVVIIKQRKVKGNVHIRPFFCV